MQKLYLLLADSILITHLLIVLFNIGSLLIIWLGCLLKWESIRNFTFRITHLLLMGFVAVQTVLGEDCPLTIWENQLRAKAGAQGPYREGFVAYWVQRVLFYDVDARVFVVAYVGFFALVLLTLFLVRPRPPRWWRRGRSWS
jgi:hypothetical protein